MDTRIWTLHAIGGLTLSVLKDGSKFGEFGPNSRAIMWEAGADPDDVRRHLDKMLAEAEGQKEKTDGQAGG